MSSNTGIWMMETDLNFIDRHGDEQTASVAEWLMAWDTLTMFEATVCGRSWVRSPTGAIYRGRPWRYSVIPSTPDFPTEYQIRRHSNPAGLPTFAAIWGPDFRASIIRLTRPHVFKQIKIYNYFDDDVQSQSSPTKLRRPTVIGMQRRGTRADGDGHWRLLVVYSARAFLARIVCFEGANPAFQSW